MCGITLERLTEIVTDQDHEEFLTKLKNAVDRYYLTTLEAHLL